jgi:predicted nucleic acid-binding protein
MVVVADTSPINYLVLIKQIDLLPRLYKRILIPPAVLAELKHPLAPTLVREWACDTPKWTEVLSPKHSLTLAQLDLGETEAIALATEMHAEVLLMDEQAGRQEAVRRGLRVAGTLSVLDEADQAGLDSFDQAVAEHRKPVFACPRPSSPR